MEKLVLVRSIGGVAALELAEGVPLAEVLRDDAVLEQEEVVPLRGAVVLGLGGPEEPGNSVSH